MPIKTRFLIVSNTHASPSCSDAGLHNLPPADVAIHCGGLTTSSTIAELHMALKLLKRLPAPLKLVIAGSSDITLDTPLFRRKAAAAAEMAMARAADKDQEQDPDHQGRQEQGHHKKEEYHLDYNPETLIKKTFGTFHKPRALLASVFTSHGIMFLDEGCYRIPLVNGALLTVYASPYTPSPSSYPTSSSSTYSSYSSYSTPSRLASSTTTWSSSSCCWESETRRMAFQYRPTEDAHGGHLFDIPGAGRTGMERVVDVVITHGPPKGILDRAPDDGDGDGRKEPEGDDEDEEEEVVMGSGRKTGVPMAILDWLGLGDGYSKSNDNGVAKKKKVVKREEKDKDAEGVGCKGLFAAVGGARPKMHCFGRAREGWGAKVIQWRRGCYGHATMMDVEKEVEIETLASLNANEERKRRFVEEGYRKTSHCAGDEHPMEPNKTLFVNACIQDADGHTTQLPWLVELDLPEDK